MPRRSATPSRSITSSCLPAKRATGASKSSWKTRAWLATRGRRGRPAPAAASSEMAMTQDFHRIKRLPPYVFAEVNALKSKARAAGQDIIDFGMGNPDQPPPQHVIDKLAATLADPRAHRYSTSRGIPGLPRALCAYSAPPFGVELDPERTATDTRSQEGGGGKDRGRNSKA